MAAPLGTATESQLPTPCIEDNRPGGSATARHAPSQCVGGEWIALLYDQIKMVGKRAVGKAGLRAANLRPKEAWAASALDAPARWTPSNV